MTILKTNTAVVLAMGPFVDKTDGVTPEDALDVSSCAGYIYHLSNAGGVPTAETITITSSGGSNDMAAMSSGLAGMYSLELTATNLNWLGDGKIVVIDTDVHIPVWEDVLVVPANIFDSLVNGTDYIQTDVVQGEGTAASGYWASATATAAAVLDMDSSGHTTAGTVGAQLFTDLDAVLVDTGTTLNDLLTTMSGKIDTIDTNVDTIVTGVALISGKVDTLDTNVDTLVTGVALISGKVDTIDGIVDDILDDTGTNGVMVSTSGVADIQSGLVSGVVDGIGDDLTSGIIDGLTDAGMATVSGLFDGIVEGTTTFQTAVQHLLARASGNVTKTGDAYAFKDRAGNTLFTLTVTSGSVTRS